MKAAQVAAQAAAIDQGHAAWSAAHASWVSVVVNLLVVVVALIVPYLLHRSDQKKTRSADASALRNGLIALRVIEESEEWIQRALKSSSRTVQDFQATVHRKIAASRYSVELALSRGVEDADIGAVLAETLMIIKEAEGALSELPPSRVPDGVGVEVLTTSRVADLARTLRRINGLEEHRHALQFQGEMLDESFSKARRKKGADAE